MERSHDQPLFKGALQKVFPPFTLLVFVSSSLTTPTRLGLAVPFDRYSCWYAATSKEGPCHAINWGPPDYHMNGIALQLNDFVQSGKSDGTFVSVNLTGLSRTHQHHVIVHV
jgi:hypothetical protein